MFIVNTPSAETRRFNSGFCEGTFVVVNVYLFLVRVYVHCIDTRNAIM